MKVAPTTCPFCLYGCELGIAIDQGAIKGVEYRRESGINQGRLCARGNGAAWLADHPRRLTEPIIEGRRTDWRRAWTEIEKILKATRVQEIAVTVDKNLTQEEVSSIAGFARACGIETVSSSYLEPEGYFQYGLPGVRAAQLADIREADLFILIGDVLNQMPLLAKPVLDARYRDRQHRIVVIDSIHTRTGFFADRFIRAEPGTEPLVLFGVYERVQGKPAPETGTTIAQVSGVPTEQIEGLAAMVNQSRRVVVAAGTALGRVEMPFLFALAPQLLVSADPDKITFLAVGEARRLVSGKGFGDIMSLIKNRKIKVLWNFGESFPFEYPQLEPILKKLDRLITTATFIPEKKGGALILPVPSNLEKTGTIPTLWGEGRLTQPVVPPSGVKSIGEILNQTASRLGIRFSPQATEMNRLVAPADALKVAEDYLQERLKSKRRRTYPFTLVGEKPAIEFQGFFIDPINRLKLNPADCTALNLKTGETAVVETAQGTEEFIIERSASVPRAVVAGSVNRRKNRRLFEAVIDRTTGDCIIPFAVAKVWKKT